MLPAGLLAPSVTTPFFFLLVLPFLAAAALVRCRSAGAGEESLLRKRLEAAGREEEGERGVLGGYAEWEAPKAAGKVCAVCGCPTTSRCSRCKAVRYCSGNCQIIHWRQGHKYECQPPVNHDVSEKNIHSRDSCSTKSQISKDNLDDLVLKPRERLLENHANEDGGLKSGNSADSSAVSSTSRSGITDNTDSAATTIKTTSNHSTDVLQNHSYSKAGSNYSSLHVLHESKTVKDDPSERQMQSRKSFGHGARHSSFSLNTDPCISKDASSTVVVEQNKESLHESRHSNSVERQNNLDNKHHGGYGLKTSIQKVVRHLTPSKSSKTCKLQMIFPYNLFVKLYNEKVELHPRGLVNVGNSCYANAVLQCLAFTHPLAAYFLQGSHHKSCLKKQWCFTCELENLVLKMKQGEDPLSPSGILSHIHDIGRPLSQGKQEDAHEFLRFSIDAMQSIFLEEANTKATGQLAEETTLLNYIFGGYLRSKIKCMKCHAKYERFDRTMDLITEIHGDVCTLSDALQKFTQTELLDNGDKYFCKRCKSHERAKKKLSIAEAPNILTIVMKRFQACKFGKINKMVEFPEVLNLAPYTSNPNDNASVYNLYAVIEHLGSTDATFSGHYICYVKNTQGKWYQADDSVVKAVSIEKVLSRQAYVLLYARSSPRPLNLSTTVTHGFSENAKGDMCQGSGKPGIARSYSHQPIRPPRESEGFESFSDTSSLLSSSDEASCSTDSTRDSISTDDYDDASGEYHDFSSHYSPHRHSPLSYRFPPETYASESSPAFLSTMDTSPSPGFASTDAGRTSYHGAMQTGPQWHHESALSSFFGI